MSDCPCLSVGQMRDGEGHVDPAAPEEEGEEEEEVEFLSVLNLPARSTEGPAVIIGGRRKEGK